MKKRFLRIGVTSIIALMMILPAVTNADVTQWIRIGAFQYRVTDSGMNSETSPGGNSLNYRGASGSQNWRWWGQRYASLDTEDAFPPFQTDPQNTGYEYMFSGTHYGSGSEDIDQWAVGDTDPLAYTITSYWRYTPPTIIVDGLYLSAPFPFPGTQQVVDASMIPGTADVLVVSTARTQMGIEVNHRAFSWSREQFDDFYIMEYNIVNSGNTNRDDDIEVETTLEGLYVNRGPSLSGTLWTSWEGMKEGDSLRMWYQYPGGSNSTYPIAMGWASGGWGRPPDPSYLGNSEFIGLVTLFAESTNLDGTDEWAQPVVHYTAGPDHQPIKAYAHNTAAGVTPDDWDNIYNIISHGPTDPNSGVLASTYDGRRGSLVMMQDNTRFTLRTDAGDWHETPSEWREDMYSASDANWAAAGWALQPHSSYGPYDLAFEDTLTLVTAWVAGGISEPVARKYGRLLDAEYDGTGPGLSTNTDLDWDNMDDPPIVIRKPDLIEPAPGDPVDVNIQRGAKLVYSGRDSLIMHAMAATYAYDNNYNIPTAPPAPDIEVTSLGTGILVEWDGTQSESVSDFAGYRVYRALGSVDSLWTLQTDISGTGTHEYLDANIATGQSYFYYVAAYDDGLSNGADYFNPAGTVLESGMFLNRTTLGAGALGPPADNMDSIRVVPNPFNLTSSYQELHFAGTDNRNKIIFTNLPELCDIRIYSESGDLIKELKHRDRSGTESWGVLPNEFSVSESGQIIVSGIYIAFIEEFKPESSADDPEPTGNTKFLKFIIVR